MKIVNLRMHQLRKLKELVLERGTLNTEALMLVLKKNQAKTEKGERMLFKYLDAQDDEKIMGRKMYALNLLNSSEYYKQIKELIIPDTIVVVDNKIAGFALPLIENHTNLGIFLSKEENNLRKKLEYLKQVGKILHQVQEIKEESFKMNFGDFNEFNFIIDKSDIVRAIDLDSVYVGQDEPSHTAYYLLKNKYLESIPDKYKLSPSGIMIPNDDTDLYCYNMILLNTLAEEPMYKKDIDTYYKYLYYLKDIGMDKELIKIFYSIYLSKPNRNPLPLLKTIHPELKEEMSYKTFKKEYKIKE